MFLLLFACFSGRSFCAFMTADNLIVVAIACVDLRSCICEVKCNQTACSLGNPAQPQRSIFRVSRLVGSSHSGLGSGRKAAHENHPSRSQESGTDRRGSVPTFSTHCKSRDFETVHF